MKRIASPLLLLLTLLMVGASRPLAERASRVEGGFAEALAKVAAAAVSSPPSVLRGRDRAGAGAADFILHSNVATASPLPQPSPGVPGEGAREPSSTTQSSPTAVRFQTVDLYIDAGDQALAAYQVTIHAGNGNAALVGLEGGEHPAFAAPPYYDPKALIAERVIVAALSTSEILPTGKTRVARLHVLISDDRDPEWVVQVMACANLKGMKLAAKATVGEVR